MEVYPFAVQEFIAALLENAERTHLHPSTWSYEIAESNPEYAVPLVRAIIGNELSLKHWTFLGALRCVPVDDLPSLAKYALDALQRNPANEPAAYVVTFISNEFPQVLHPYLRIILSLCEQANLDDATEAWRGAEWQEVLHLKDVYDTAEVGTYIRDFALRALLETHDQTILQQLVSSIPEASLLEAGYAVNDSVLQKLFPSVAYHLRFPDGYPDPSASWEQRMHPTWHLPYADVKPMVLGGMIDGVCQCRSCGENIHHLLTLSPVPEGLGVTCLEELTVAVCLSCLGWEPGMASAFYRHDSSGMPVEHVNFDGPRIVPEFPAGPLRPVAVHLSEMPVPWHFQHWSDRENIFRVGGHPAWVQGAEYPNCPLCTRQMPFLLQLDSDLSVDNTPFNPHVTGWLWGSGGVAYIFWCDHCRVSAISAQWT